MCEKCLRENINYKNQCLDFESSAFVGNFKIKADFKCFNNLLQLHISLDESKMTIEH